MPSREVEDIELTVPTLARTPQAIRPGSIASLSTLDAKYDHALDSPLASPIHAKRDPFASYAGSTASVPRADAVERRLRRLSVNEPADEASGVLPPIDGGAGPWAFVVVGWLLEIFIWGFSYSFPTILVYLQQNEPWKESSLAELSSIGTVLISIEFFLPNAVIIFFKRYPEWRRTTMVAATAVNFATMLGSSWASKTWHLIILQGVFGGVCGAILYTPVLMFLNDWWQERRGMASGIVFSGTSVGGFCFPFLIEHLLHKYSFATMCQVWAAMSFVVYAAATVFLKPRAPTRRVPKGADRGPWLPASPRLLLDPVVIVMSAFTFIFSLPYYQVSFYLPTYTLSLGNASNSTLVVGLFNLSASFGSFVTGWASDRSLPLTLTVMSLASGVIAFLSWGYSDTLAKIYGFSVAFAFFSAVYSGWGAAARDAAGANPHLSTMIICVFGVARGVASIVGPYIGTALYDPKAAADAPQWGRYGFSRVIVFSGVVSLLSALGGYGLRWARQQNTRRAALGQRRESAVSRAGAEGGHVE
ncbi:hypothetical protein JCM8097_002828 [Rhodosporidiobolus ruineniae]